MTSAASLPRDGVLAEIARRHLRDFIEAAWPIVEPRRAFVGNWHIDAICEHLEAVTAGQIDRLLINVPPGCMKSLIVSVFWPVWEWIQNPSLRYLTASYSDALSIRDLLRVRDIVESGWYARHYPNVRLSSDQNAKVRVDTTGKGWRIATSVGGKATGEHPNRIIIDDPHTALQAESDVKRENVLTWYDGTISTRGIALDPATVIVMQRLHERDLSGHLLERSGWTHLCLPMCWEPDRMPTTVLGWNDPRTTPGELLWPALFTQQKVDTMVENLVYGSAGQLQQRPSPAGGALFKREWFTQFVDMPPENVVKRVRAWDFAASEGAGDYTVGVKMSVTKDKTYYVEHVVRGRYGAGQGDEVMLATARADGNACRQHEEQEPGSAGKKVVEAHAIMLSGYSYTAERASGDKETRARPFRAQCEFGHVVLVRGAWNQAFIDELCSFPRGAHDDQVDGASAGFNQIALTPPPSPSEAMDIGLKSSSGVNYNRRL